MLIPAEESFLRIQLSTLKTLRTRDPAEKKLQHCSPINTLRRYRRYCATQNLHRNKLMNEPSGQWVKENPPTHRPSTAQWCSPPMTIQAGTL